MSKNGVKDDQAIRLLGEFIIDEANNHIAENEFLRKSQRHFENLRPNSTTQHGNKVVFVLTDHQSCVP